MSLIGLDIGTTGCKCTIFDYVGNIQSSSYKEYPIENKEIGKYELDPGKVWAAVKRILYEARKNNQGEDPVALSISTLGEAATPVDINGNILHNSILYMDIRGLQEVEVLKKNLGVDRIMELTGIPPQSMYTINKVMWIKKNLPEIYSKTWKFMLYEDLILFLMTGISVIDYSLASRTMAFNVIKKEWEPSVFEAAGVDVNLFSKPEPSGTVVGTIKKELAEELGLPRNLVVVTGGHDQACAALGAGVISEKLAVEGIGTADCITTAFRKPVLNNVMRECNFNCEPHILPDMYISLSFTLSGGSLLKWYRNCFGSVEQAEANKNKMNVYQLLDEKAAKDPTNILVLPHFSGSGTPHLDPYSKGAIIGLTLETTPSQIYRSLLEGVTYEMRYNLECMAEAGIQVDRLRAVGGGANSDLWLQIKADITGKEVERMSVNEAGTLAAALIAGTAAGIYPSYQDAAKLLIESGRTFYPNLKVKDVYEENFSRYKNLYQALKKIG